MTDQVDQKTGNETPAEGIEAEVAARVMAETGYYPDPSMNNGRVVSEYVRACLDMNELGDGLLYVALNKGKFVYNATADQWLRWTGQHWEYDEHRAHLAAVENVVDRLLEETTSLSEQIDLAIKNKDKERRASLEKRRKEIYGRIGQLRKERGRNPCVKFAISCKDSLSISAEQLDLHPWLLACPNGVMDLRSGKFKDGRPEDYITIVCPTKWTGFDSPCPRWEKSLLEIMNGDEEMAAFLRRLFGYAITGSTREHIMPVFWGRGRNGKGTIIKVLQHVMGRLAGSIQTEMLLYSKMTRSSAGPSPDILDLRGLRMAFASETDEGQKFSAAKVKWLTGADQLVCRGLQEKKQVRFNPTHTIFLSTNNKPRVSGDDYAFWKRMVLIRFKLSYVTGKSPEELEEWERIANPDLEDELKEEASGILAWLVKGCIEYQKHGLILPETVIDDTREYQRDEDNLGQFLEHYCLMKDGVKTKSSDIFDVFDQWWRKAVSSKGISQNAFGRMMKRRFDSSKIKGVYHYHGVMLNADRVFELDGDD